MADRPDITGNAYVLQSTDEGKYFRVRRYGVNEDGATEIKHTQVIGPVAPITTGTGVTWAELPTWAEMPTWSQIQGA